MAKREKIIIDGKEYKLVEKKEIDNRSKIVGYNHGEGNKQIRIKYIAAVAKQDIEIEYYAEKKTLKAGESGNSGPVAELVRLDIVDIDETDINLLGEEIKKYGINEVPPCSVEFEMIEKLIEERKFELRFICESQTHYSG